LIANKDRSGYIGASDTGYVMRRWNTKSFEKWWREKQGFVQNNICTDAMKAGTAWEHKILDALNIPGLVKDKQIIKGRLRVNYDGLSPVEVIEVKTHAAGKPFKVTADYRRQVNVEMYQAEIRKARIVAYALLPEDYKNYYREVDPQRLSFHTIKYDETFIARYVPRKDYLCMCLETGRFPRESEVVYE
jgi:hypothetical protein